MRQRWWSRVALVLALALGVGMAVPALSQVADAPASIRVFQFQPGAIRVHVGTRVTWTNLDEITHTVTSGEPGRPDGRFDLSLAAKGTSGSATFSAPGAYPYFCARHPSMRGQVVVE